MSSDAQKLLADHEQIQKLLELYPNIKLIETEGDPPERYDIEYNIKGYKTGIDGSAVPANSHQVRITLPFGYPHFPPTAKPLSSIFHPDIDPDAIRIADFWHDNKSLADLILHIGEMVCGTHVSEGEPFNQSAADWYEERKSWLPFDTLEPCSPEDNLDDVEMEVTDSPKDQAASPEQKIPAEPRSRSGKPLDILKEDFDFPFDEDELPDGVKIVLGKDDAVPPPLDDAQEEPAYEIDLTEELQDQDDDISINFDIEDDQDLTDSLTEEESEDLIALEEDDISLGVDIKEEVDDLAVLEDEDLPTDFNLEEDPGTKATGDAEEELVGIGDAEESIDFNLKVEPDTDQNESSTESAETTLDSLDTEDEFTGLDDDSLSGLDLSDEDLTGQESPPEDEISHPTEEEGSSGLDDNSLSGLDLSEEEPPDGPEGKTSSGEAGSIEPLIEKKEIFTAKKVLADVQDTSTIPNRKELEQKISEAISEAEELYKKADALEQKGELEKAGLILDLVANIVIDYPGLEFARNRIRESMMSEGGKKEEGGGETTEAKKKKPRKISVKIPYKLIAAVLVIIGLIGGGTSVYLRDSDNIQKAIKDFKQAEELVEKKEYKSADNSLKSAKTALDSILFLQKDEKGKLHKKIDSLSNSQSFKEGLQGRVLYDGKYVTVEMAKNIDKFISLKNDAEVQLNSTNIDKAIELYEKAIAAAEKIDFDEEAQTIAQTINNLRLNQTLAQARKAEDEKEWKQAADTYAKALELSKNLSTSDNKNEIATHLATASFRHELDLSKRAFTASEWQKTIEMLQRALSILEANPDIASESEKTELHKLLINSKLYHMLSGAKKAFEKKEWEQAVNEYKDAIYLLEHNSDVLGEEIHDSVSKIQKTILMTQITREQELSTQTINNNDLESTRKHYLTIASLIEDSSFKDDKMFNKIYDNARTQSVTLEKEIVINRRVDWLIEHSEEIFRKNYPSAKLSKLLKPQATFIKKEGKKLIFNMSCVEKKQGRSFRLELNYQYDQETDTWSIYSGKL